MNNRVYTYLKKLFREVFFSPVYYLSWLFPKKDNLWVFGEWHGLGYSDNAKYLFEYVVENEPSVNPVWITKDSGVYKELKGSGLPVAKAYSKQGLSYCLRASYIFVTHGPSDVNQFVLASSQIVNLTHGTPLKRLGKDARYKRLGRFTWLFDNIIARFIPAKKSASYIVAASEEAKNRFCSAYSVKKEVLSLGYPRWKPLVEGDSYTDISLHRKKYSRIILYAPTLRKNNHQQLQPFQFKGFDDFVSYLEKNNALLIIRPHPVVDFDLKGYTSKHLFIAASRNYKDVNRILPEVDVLVTDFSSVMYDFAILEREIYLLAPDAEEYIYDDVGVYGDYYRDALGPVVQDWVGLQAAMEEGFFIHHSQKYNKSIIGCNYEDSSKRIVKYFLNTKFAKFGS